MKPPKDMERKVRNASVATNEAIDTRVLKMMREAYEQSVHMPAAGQVTSHKPVLLIRASGLAIAAAIIVIALVAVNPFSGPNGGLALGEILANMDHIQAFHAKVYQYERERVYEVWGKRPNMLRYEYDEGIVEISNGPTMWVVNPPFNKATQKQSYYFNNAQRRGLDVVDDFIRRRFTEGLNGFLSEGPIDQIMEKGRRYDVYRMKFGSRGRRIRSEALVDAGTHLLDSLSIDVDEGDGFVCVFELSDIEYNVAIADEMFVFAPPEGMEVVVEEASVPQATALAQGATLSGVITWASTGKPVVGARLTLIGGNVVTNSDGNRGPEFSKSVESDRNGAWACMGVPVGHVRIRVRSWQYEWPAVPSFTTNVGTLDSPAVVTDGHGEYTGLDFKVYKPDDYYATITATVINEDGEPIRGASAFLEDVETGRVGEHLRATPRGPSRTQGDGRFNSPGMSPTAHPVRLHVGPGDPNGPYVLRGVYTEPFIIHPQRSYHFDVVLPYPRAMTVRVVDPNGRPVQGVVALGLDSHYASPISAADWSQPQLTDSGGCVDISGMRPGEEVLVGLKRLDADEPAMLSPLISALAHATAPTDRSKPVVEVIFDEQPIAVEGRLSLGPEVQGSFVVVHVTGQRGQLRHMPFVRALIDEQGEFTLHGVPAGMIRLLYSATGSDGTSRRDDAFMTVEPGNRYRVEFTEEGLRVLGREPIP